MVKIGAIVEKLQKSQLTSDRPDREEANKTEPCSYENMQVVKCTVKLLYAMANLIIGNLLQHVLLLFTSPEFVVDDCSEMI